MKKLYKFIGIIALAVVITFSLAGCSGPETDTETEPETKPEHIHDWGEWTPTIYPNAVLGGWEKRLCKLDDSHSESRRVTRPADATVVPEDFSAAERWTKEIDIPVTATLDFVIEKIDGNDVCKVTVSNAVNTTRWKANVHYYYTAEANTTYEYEFEAWTVSGTRTLGIQCYYDFDTSDSVMTGEQTITAEKTTYTVRGGTIPKDGIRSLQFHCADKTGTFYVRVISIKPYVLEELPPADRWSKNVDSAATVTLEYELQDDGVCKITLDGTAMPNVEGNWNAWRARANYLFTAQANTSYTFVVEAWVGEGEDDHWLDIQYYYDDAANIYRDTGGIITNERKTYTFISGAGPILKGGVRELRFQCAHKTGVIYVNIISIAPSVEKTIAISGIGDLISGSYYAEGMIGLFSAETTPEQALQAAERYNEYGDWNIIVAGSSLSAAGVDDSYTIAYFPLHFKYFDDVIPWTGGGSYKIGIIAMINGETKFYWIDDLVDFSGEITTIEFNSGWEIDLD